LATKATKALNVKFVSVDIARIDNQLKIIEINSGVMLERFSQQSTANYQLAKNIYKRVITDL
jgi:glutathione synthase/RimK-type ligase-like ATP-grasp enzyme